MGRMTLKEWARLHGVSLRKIRHGFLDYTAVITCRGRELRVPGLAYPFGPNLAEALREHVKAAQVAEAFHGDFGAYSAKQGRREPVERQAARFAPGSVAREQLYEVFGRRAARTLLLQVKDFI